MKNIFAGGDIAFAPVFVNNDQRLAIGHWQVAQYHGHIAAKNMLGKKTSLHTVPFFWANLFGTSFRYAGKIYTIFAITLVQLLRKRCLRNAADLWCILK